MKLAFRISLFLILAFEFPIISQHLSWTYSVGLFDWAATISVPHLEIPKAISTDRRNNIFVTGLFFGVTDFNPDPEVTNLVSKGDSDLFICKLSKNTNTAINHSNEINQISIYPNPSKGFLIISADQIQKIEIIDLLGKGICTQKIKQRIQSSTAIISYDSRYLHSYNPKQIKYV